MPARFPGVFLHRIFPNFQVKSFNIVKTLKKLFLSFTHYMKKIFLLPLLWLIVSCKNKEKEPDIPHPDTPKSLSYSIVATFPHDTAAYTQGLVIHQGELYEGTGNYGFSKIRKVDLKTGKSLQELLLEKKYFGEGITILRDRIYQLTWKERIVFVYDLKFKKIREFPIETDGWGITNDGRQLIVSTGGSDLFFYAPDDFKLLKTQTVTDAGSPSFNLNELEYINGYIYANQYEYPYILKIDPSNGKIVAKADVTQMWNRIKAIEPRADVPNGIAWDSSSKKVYITGKWWPELYEVKFAE
jgi:glutamine cyclotransferase